MFYDKNIAAIVTRVRDLTFFIGWDGSLEVVDGNYLILGPGSCSCTMIEGLVHYTDEFWSTYVPNLKFHSQRFFRKNVADIAVLYIVNMEGFVQKVSHSNKEVYEK